MGWGTDDNQNYYFSAGSKDPSGERRYSVHCLCITSGNQGIETIGKFRQFKTMKEAQREAKRLANQ